MKIAMLVHNPCTNDARVIREAESLAGVGHIVTVLALRRPGLPVREERNGVSYLRLGWVPAIDAPIAQPAGVVVQPPSSRSDPSRRLRRRLRAVAGSVLNLLAVNSLRVMFVNLWIFYPALRRLGADVIHAHELHTLFTAWLASRTGAARLVYDSHELEVGRNGTFLPHEQWLRKALEGLAIRRATAVITVSDSIAEYLARLYSIPTPLVIQNAPQNTAKTKVARSLRESLGLLPTTPLLVYVGKITTNRGIEVGVRALAHVPGAHLALVGPSSEKVLDSILELAIRMKVRERLHVVPPVLPEEVCSFIADADLSLVLIQGSCLSYAMCFPNKLLESILAGVPVLASNLVELRRVVEETGAGLVVDAGDEEAVVAAVRAGLAQRQGLAPTEAVMSLVNERYGWPTQEARLRALYARLEEN